MSCCPQPLARWLWKRYAELERVLAADVAQIVLDRPQRLLGSVKGRARPRLLNSVNVDGGEVDVAVEHVLHAELVLPATAGIGRVR